MNEAGQEKRDTVGFSWLCEERRTAAEDSGETLRRVNNGDHQTEVPQARN